MPDVHGHQFSSGYNYESVHSRHRRDVQRHEFSVRECELACIASLEKPFPRGCHHSQHGSALYDSLRSVLHGELPVCDVASVLILSFNRLCSRSPHSTGLNGKLYYT